MHTNVQTHRGPSEYAAASRRAYLAAPQDGGTRYTSHGRAALATALDDGLMPDEVARILSGRRITDAFPVRHGESPPAYAARAVAEMFVAYLQ